MICNIDSSGACAICKRPERRKGFARMCCGSPGCSAATIANKFSSTEYELMTKMRGAPPQNGPGTELKKLLAAWPLRIVATPNCSCNARAAEMDRKGCDWCEENIDTIIGWLREEARRAAS
jgi:hypothetical protein